MNRVRDVCTLEINNYQEGKKLKISPVGEFKGLDGRVFTLTKNAIEQTKAQGINLHINVEHGFTSTFNNQAVGWIELDTLEIKDDGVYAVVNFNEDGKKLVESKAYRYLSPEFIINQKREVLTIEAVALTNRPNLKLEINKKEKQMQKDDKTKELNQKIDSLQTELNSKNEEIKTLTQKLKEHTFNTALKDGKVVPAQKEFALSLELNQLESWISSLDKAGHLNPLNPQQGSKDDNEKELDEFAKQINW